MTKAISFLIIAMTIVVGAHARAERAIPFIERSLEHIQTPILKAYRDAVKMTAVEHGEQGESVVYEDGPRHRRPFGQKDDISRPSYVVVRTYDKATYAHKRDVGTRLIICGSVLLPSGIAMAVTANANNNLNLGAFFFLFFGGILLSAGGLGTLIPGIILRTKYNKYVD